MIAKLIPFNPLDKKNLGASVVDALLASKVHPLENIPEFNGAGIYAIYYSGNFKTYEKLTKQNQGGNYYVPIYVGKADPAGGRKGKEAVSGTVGKTLYKRLNEHAESIRAAKNLDIADFCCRYLAVDDIWIPLGESLLIAHFSPVWNALIDGFGNHDPGRGRYNGMRPRWDVLHPGRKWAEKCQERPESVKDIEKDVETYLKNSTFPSSSRLFIEGD